ncbi:GNAT family N-acetyltransferase [Candidatus Bipolaricaulota bacterium]|nr:GNAT family N-acetyltransferase [Candidatus Bipolaricaulota bacterium]
MTIAVQPTRIVNAVNQEIRKFEKTDRDRIRKIATSTVTGYPRSDLQLVADLLTNYYIIYEPEHLLVAEVDGRVVGYLSGCFNGSRCRWIKGTRVIPKAIFGALVRGEIGWKEVRYLGSFIYVTIHSGLRNAPPSGYPAHFHINISEGWRGKGLGRKLATEFISMLEEAGVSGVHVRVRQNARRASRFFRSLGFTRENGYPILVAEEGKFRTSRSIIYKKKIDDSA